MKKSTRDAIGDILPLMGEKYKEIVVLGLDLAGATKTSSFKKKFPDRFIDVGIAEANGIGIASGLSEHGFKVFVPSFASFLTGRYDIIRCSLAYPNCSVVLVGTHVGMAIGKDGVTQMGLEDVSIMRALPNMKILNPATYSEAIDVIKYLCETRLEGPHYLRLGRQPVEDIYENAKKHFQFGKAHIAKGGGTADNITLFSTGCILSDAIKAAEQIEEKTNYTIRVVNFSTLKPIDKEMIIRCAQETNHLFSIEDHSIVGGLGSIISEVLTDSYPKKLTRIGLNDVFPESGKPEDLYEKYGLSVGKMYDIIMNVITKGE